jgi:2,5-diamino-6-(ribosylamino)-4(3H)-pyrimidinone 5'-phosphate reductase
MIGRPYVVVHVAVSVEGATTGFDPDVGRFYELAKTWREDVTLVGADTILAQEETLASAPRPGPAADGPLLAVVDGRARVTAWDALRDAGHWRDVLALHARATPARPADREVRELVVGEQRVDLAAALQELGDRHGARIVRVDSGGALTGALLQGGLVDEISLLIHPCLASGPDERHWYGERPLAAGDLDLLGAQRLDGGLIWLHYRIVH